MVIKNLSLIVAFAIITVISTVAPQCLSENDSTIKKTSRLNLYEGQQKFTLNLLDKINKASPEDNIFFSPYSTYQALLLAYFGSAGVTEEALRNTLNLEWASNKFEVVTAYRFQGNEQIRRYSNNSLQFTSADKIYIAKQAGLRECMKTLFHYEYEELDFVEDPSKCEDLINEFVKNETRGNIQDILPSGTLTPATTLVLANAAYFKGQWTSQFDPQLTKSEIFYTSTSQHKFVNMMNMKGTFNHAVNEELGCHILELPYNTKDNSVSMMIFLPPFQQNSLDDVLRKLTTESFQNALTQGFSREVEVKLPKIKFEKRVELVPILSQMGIGNLFESTSNLTTFTDKIKLQLDGATHQAKIEVDEEGSTAAAATVLFSFRSSRPAEPAQFFCNHPFLFLIYDHKSKAVLFSGLYRTPE